MKTMFYKQDESILICLFIYGACLSAVCYDCVFFILNTFVYIFKKAKCCLNSSYKVPYKHT